MGRPRSGSWRPCFKQNDQRSLTSGIYLLVNKQTDKSVIMKHTGMNVNNV